MTAPMKEVLPAFFLGHGNPMNALQNNAYTDGWRRIAEGLPRPRAILAISAHWFVPTTAVTIAAQPRTIHDFGGFPQELYQVQYPAPGDQALARRVRELLSPQKVEFDDYWGLDHGTWSVLRHLYPAADVPVVQLSINEAHGASWHFEAGQRLAALRREGVLILGSGNIVHNLHAYAWGRHAQEPYDWALSFENEAKRCMALGEFAPLIDYEQLGRAAQMSIPTPDHYLPLLYALGTREGNEPVTFPVDGIDGGSISMLCVQVG
ncbi:MAG TPA: 4,5-DOPA dioxygenase extradiol [Steroidobacteraceae bacterium]|nr:4,5-DOPA dioxygenase extradiol [Steroidobacteraceae bacterium]